MGTSCASRTECAGRSRLATPSMFKGVDAHEAGAGSDQPLRQFPVRYGCPSKYCSVPQCWSQPVCTKTARARTSRSISESRSMAPSWPDGSRATTQSRFANDSKGRAATSLPPGYR